MENLEQKISEKYGNTTGIVIWKDGKTVYEKYFQGCTRDSRIHVYSVTKSIVSALIGIALEEGVIKSLNQRVLEFFPDYIVKDKEKSIQNITLRNLLTMTAPYKYRFFPPYIKYFTSEDWVRFSLDLLGGSGRIGTFRYAPLIGPDILSGILVKTTGRSVFDFASDKLFAPLGITVEKCLTFRDKKEQMEFNKATDISGWVMDQSGVNSAGWGLTLSAMDMAKIGQLYLNGGNWNGKQMIDESWIKESTREQSCFKKRNLPYGYLWWIGEDGFAAMGDGGNIIYVNTKKELVVAIAALFVPRAGDRIALIKDCIEPLFE